MSCSSAVSLRTPLLPPGCPSCHWQVTELWSPDRKPAASVDTFQYLVLWWPIPTTGNFCPVPWMVNDVFQQRNVCSVHMFCVNHTRAPESSSAGKTWFFVVFFFKKKTKSSSLKKHIKPHQSLRKLGAKEQTSRMVVMSWRIMRRQGCRAQGSLRTGVKNTQQSRGEASTGRKLVDPGKQRKGAEELLKFLTQATFA